MKALLSLLLASFLLSGSFAAYSQTDTLSHAPAVTQLKPDKVYLKSGEVITGYMVEQTPGECVTYRTTDGELRVIDVAEIKRADRNNDKGHSKQGVKPGLHWNVGAGFLCGTTKFMDSESTSANRLFIDANIGNQFDHSFFLGAGLTWQYYYQGCSSMFSKAFSAFPIYADARFTLFNNRYTPFVDVRVGGYVGKLMGFYFHPSIGFRIAIDERAGMNIAIGYTVQPISNNPKTDNGIDLSLHKDMKGNLNGLSVALSVDF